MWRILLNNAVLTTTTHRRPERVSDGTSTQVVAQMINKYRIKIVQRELYNGRDPSWIVDRKNHERNTVTIKNQICNQSCVKYIRTHLLGLCGGRFSLEKTIYLLALDILSYCPTHFSPIFQLTLYKFIVLGFLGLSPFFLGWVPNLVLTIIIIIILYYLTKSLARIINKYFLRHVNCYYLIWHWVDIE